MKLNLGCGHRKLDGYINADSSVECKPDVLFDLEHFHWPWEKNSVQEIRMQHVLEHVGQTPEGFIHIMQELYRVCAPGAHVYIEVPHPRSDGFICDPTHVRPIMPQMLALFSKQFNRDTIAKGWPNTPLGLMHDIDFEIVDTKIYLQPGWEHLISDPVAMQRTIDIYFNVVSDIHITLRKVVDAPE